MNWKSLNFLYCLASNSNPVRNLLNFYLGERKIVIPRVSTLYYVSNVVFLSNRQPHKNKRYNFLFIRKSKKINWQNTNLPLE